MAKSVFTPIFATLAILTMCSALDGKSAKLRAYEEYYNATEELLDTLESHYNWVDAEDPQNYYIAREHILNLK